MYSKVKLTDIGVLKRGKSKHRPRNDKSLFGGNYPFIQTGDIKKANWKITEYSETYNEIGLKQSKLWNKDTLCITIAANIADTAILDFDACFPDSVLGFVPNKELANVYYIDYAIRKHKRKLEKLATKTAQKNINLGTFESLELIIPDIDKQNAIAEIIIPFDEKIMLNEKLLKNLLDYSSLIYKKWFVDFNFPNKNGLTYKENNGEMVKVEDKMIPKDWQISYLGVWSKAKIIKAGIDKFDNVKKYITTSDVDGLNISDNLEFINFEDRTSRANMQPRKYSVWFAKMKDSIKHINVIDEFDYANFIFSTGFTGINCTEDSFAYISTFINSEKFENLKNKFANGSTQKAINDSNTKRIELLIPNQNVLNMFSDLILPIIEKTNELLSENKALMEARDLLIKKLIK